MKHAIRIFCAAMVVTGGLALTGCSDAASDNQNKTALEQDNNKKLQGLTTGPSNFNTNSTQPIAGP